MRLLNASDPQTVGPYRLLAELGSGGMGRVYLGAGPDGRLVAVKLIHARLAADPDFRARFSREAAATARVSGAYTAAVVNADPDAAEPWLASVFVAAPTLSDAVAALGPLPESSVLRLASGLAAALEQIHQAGLVHRDLKPSNVLLAADGPMVIDFGIARALDDADTTLTSAGTVIGSPGFMSPEQAQGSAVGPASDVFSLGSVLFAAGTGVPGGPFAAPGTPQILYTIVHTMPDLSSLPASVRRIVGPCLAKDPEQRPQPRYIQHLVGALPPSSRPWSTGVRGLIDEQRRELGRILDQTRRPREPQTPIRPIDREPSGGRTGARTTRRAAVVIGGLGAVAATAAVVAAVELDSPGGGTVTNPPASATGSGVTAPSSATGTGGAGGLVLASTSQVPVKGGYIDSATAIVVTQPVAGEYKAFTAICTHVQCLVASVSDNVILCPCHGSEYDAATGHVVRGPATSPLAPRSIEVSGDKIVYEG